MNFAPDSGLLSRYFGGRWRMGKLQCRAKFSGSRRAAYWFNKQLFLLYDALPSPRRPVAYSLSWGPSGVGIFSWGNSCIGPVARRVPSLSDLLCGALWGFRAIKVWIRPWGPSQSGGSKPDKLGTRLMATLAPGGFGRLGEGPQLRTDAALCGDKRTSENSPKVRRRETTTTCRHQHHPLYVPGGRIHKSVYHRPRD